MSKADWVIAALIVVAMVCAFVLGLAVGAAFTCQAADTAMWELVDGYDTCLSAPGRTTGCILEYDGDGGSNTAADWRWGWE